MTRLMIVVIKFYQCVISRYVFPLRHCRFTPTCSEYALKAYRKYGFFKGTFLTVKRVLRCHPFNPGGYDPLP